MSIRLRKAFRAKADIILLTTVLVLIIRMYSTYSNTQFEKKHHHGQKEAREKNTQNKGEIQGKRQGKRQAKRQAKRRGQNNTNDRKKR